MQVVPGHTYYLKITRPEGLNAFRVNRNNYAGGNYFENGASVPGAELMGLVVCGNFTNAGPTGTLVGLVRDDSSNALGGARVSVADAALYTTTAADGSYTLPCVPVGTYDVTASSAGYIARLNTGVVISVGLTTTSSFTLTLQTTNPGSGLVTDGSSVLQPFEAEPPWSSTFDAAWGNGATFSIVSGGQTGNALLRLRSVVDDGAVFWLNGTEFFRLGITNNPVTHTSRASRAVGVAAYEGPFDLAAPSLVRGTNVLAVEVHQADPTSSDVAFGTTVEALVLPSQVPITNAVLTLTRETNGLTLRWSEPVMTLESAKNPAGPWTADGGTSPRVVDPTNGASFFRLRQ